MLKVQRGVRPHVAQRRGAKLDGRPIVNNGPEAIAMTGAAGDSRRWRAAAVLATFSACASRDASIVQFSGNFSCVSDGGRAAVCGSKRRVDWWVTNATHPMTQS